MQLCIKDIPDDGAYYAFVICSFSSCCCFFFRQAFFHICNFMMFRLAEILLSACSFRLFYTMAGFLSVISLLSLINLNIFSVLSALDLQSIVYLYGRG
jgi:hypothetical protein